MFDWNSDPFSDRDPWFTVWRGGARRRPKSEEDANTCDEDLQPEAQPGPIAADEESEARPISLFKKAGWVEAETKFKSQATLFAEFQIHPALKDRPVEFQLLRRKDGAFVHDATALGKPDASGRATVTVPIHKEYSESDTFRIQARHGGMAWSNSRNTDREVSETAEEVFEHKAVSGIHFPENSSFIVPAYLTTFHELDKAFTDWRRTHPNAKLVVFGHSERNEEDPRKLSERRAKIAFAFLIGDHFTWGDIAKEEAWGVWEQQHMLQAMGFYKEKVDGIKGPKTDKAILDFITWLNETECKGINPMLGFTEEYIRLELYRVYITASKRAVSIPSGYFRTVSGYPNVGCTAFNRYKGGDGNHGENRRATFLMLEENLSFPVTFPCRSTVGPCEAEAGKAGDRAVKGFLCGFYDNIMKTEEAMGDIVEGPDKASLESESFVIFAATIYGESANSSEIAWRSIAHVIMNRISKREWSKHKTASDICKYTGFDAYTQKNLPYVKCYEYLKNLKTGSNRHIDKFVAAISKVYKKEEPDFTGNSILYYSPRAQTYLHKENPGLYDEKPRWNFKVLEEVSIDGLLQTDDFKFYRYK